MNGSNDSGFTLIELLVVISILGILSAISIQTYSELRTAAYDNSAISLLHDAQNALEAGLIEIQEDNDPWLWVSIWSGGDGSVWGDMNRLMPGLQVNNKMRIWAYHDAWCEQQPPNNWCAVNWIETAHCEGKVTRAWSRYTDGTIREWEWANWGC